MFISFIDLAFIGHLEAATTAIAAAAIANNVCAAIYSFLEGIRTGTTILVARFFGAKQKNNISKTINLAICSAIIVGITGFLLVPIIGPFLYSFMKNHGISKIGVPYLTIRLIGLPFHLIIFAIIGIFRGLKNTFYPFLITITICFSNALLNYIFIPKFAVPTNAIAFATALSYIIGTLISLIFLFRIKLTRQFLRLKTNFRPLVKTFVRTGTEIGLYSGVVILALFIFVFLFTALGTTALAAHQIVFQLFLLTYLPSMGFFVAAAILVGKILGEKKHNLVIPAAIRIWRSSIPLVGSVLVLVALFAPYIAHFFSPTDPVVAKTARNSIYLICVMQLFVSIYLVIKGALTAAKDTRFLFVVGTITTYLFFLPTSYFYAIHLGYGVFGGYCVFLLWSILDTIIFSWRFFIKKPWL
jgi:putative MATE family efflux protein